MMAACALIACSRGNIDEIEKEYLRKNLGSVELFRHVESDFALSLFEQFAEQIAEGRKEAILRKLKAISDEPRLTRLVMSIAHGMTSLHSHVLPEEESALQEIASTMKTTTNIEELIAQARKNN
jgi:tellurite resistance protein